MTNARDEMVERLRITLCATKDDVQASCVGGCPLVKGWDCADEARTVLAALAPADLALLAKERGWPTKEMLMAAAQRMRQIYDATGSTAGARDIFNAMLDEASRTRTDGDG